QRVVSLGRSCLSQPGGRDRPQTVDALRRVLPWLKEEGYSFGFPVR
ncbi:polysaccharide deacetylase family protein, partial [Streptomyces sp. NPDC057062]